ncbi:MAG: hypothetical protein IPI98_02550 [Chitinophagaceae bacterium]|nr:hypothetical protein [Chitinophagaceae bacterium]
MNKAKKTKHFEIETYFKDAKRIEVCLTKGELGLSVFIPTDKFISWLDENSRLEYVIDGVDHNGEHKQVFGKIPIDEYFVEVDSHAIFTDLYDYIVQNPITYRRRIYENSLDSILAAFENYPKSPLNF